MSKIFKFESEAAMCSAFMSVADAFGWTCYPETAGFDILAVHRETGYQCGIEAKQTFNAHVLSQVIDRYKMPHLTGPDLRAVLVPHGGAEGLDGLARHLGVTVIRARGVPLVRKSGEYRNWCRIGYAETAAFNPFLPKELEDLYRYSFWNDEEIWRDLCPLTRCALPDYIPDVAAGASSPVALTDWKIKAIKLAILLEKRGYVTAHHFKELKLSMSRWTQGGWLRPGDVRGNWIRGKHMPEFWNQHPTNYVQIEEDFESWGTALMGKTGEQKGLGL